MAKYHKLPNATEVQKLEKKSLVSYIHIEPIGVWRQYGPAPVSSSTMPSKPLRISASSAFERDKLNESERALMTICLKYDHTTMGRITKSSELRANA